MSNTALGTHPLAATVVLLALRAMRRSVLAAFGMLLPVAANLAAAYEANDSALAILRDNCLACHSKAASMSGLDLSTRESALKGGQRGPAILPGRAADSRL